MATPLTAVELSIEDNRVILSTPDNETAQLFAKAVIILLASMRPDHMEILPPRDGRPMN